MDAEQLEFFSEPRAGAKRLERLALTAPLESAGSLADAWARAVCSGEIAANVRIKAAAARYEAMRASPESYGLWWDEEAVTEARDFARVCGRGNEDMAGEPLDWLPWQCAVAMILLGAKRLEDGERTDFPYFKAVILTVAKGNGKSEFAASLTMAGMRDPTKPLSFACSAPDGRLAQIVYERMRTMTATLNEGGGMPLWVATGGTSIATPGKVRHGRAFFTTLPCTDKALDGRMDRLVIADEVARMPKGVGRLITGLAKNPKSQFLAITTPDEGQRSMPIWAYWDKLETALEKGTELPRTWFGFFFGLDAEDSAYDESCYIKAHPSLGVTTQAYDIRAAAETMLGSGDPKQIAEFETQTACRYHESTQTSDVDVAILTRQTEAFDWEPLSGRSCVIGLDLSRGGYGPQLDLTSLCYMVEGEDGRVYADTVSWWAGVDIQLDAQRSKMPLGAWVEQGILRRMPGEWQDMDVIEAELQTLMARFNVRKIGVDPHSSQTKWVKRWMDRGWPVVAVDQSIRTMAPAWKIWGDYLRSRQLVNQPSPILAFALRAVRLVKDNVGNIRPVKGRSDGNTDPVVAGNIAALLMEVHDIRGGSSLENAKYPI